jgi:hypothetical protein
MTNKEEKRRKFNKMLLNAIEEGFDTIIEIIEDEYFDDGYCEGYRDGKAGKQT